MKQSTLFGCLFTLCALFGVTSAAQGDTVAYWPMQMTPDEGGATRQIKDKSGNGYDLNVALNDTQAVNTSEIPFTRPPNGPTDVTISSCAEIVNGTKVAENAFVRGTSVQTQTEDPVVLALGMLHDFTLEGYMYVKSLKHGNDADTIIAFSGINGTGDWIWNLTEPTSGSNTRQVRVIMRNGTKVENSGVLTTISDSEIVGGWHHYALVFTRNVENDQSRWAFYLDGVRRGSQLMPNRIASAHVQHDRFQLGGANSSTKKTLDAKFAFWRISNVALASEDFLRHREFTTTVAYWPMNVVAAQDGSSYTNIAPDLVDGRNTLTLRDSAKGGLSWTASDIGWTTPPNPDAELTAAGVDCTSTTMVCSGNNTSKIGGNYREVFGTTSTSPVIATTTLTNAFTIEGYLRLTTLPDGNSKNQMFIYNTLGETGGWQWSLYGTNSLNRLSMQVLYKPSGNRTILSICSNLRAEELLDIWNHYALTFTPDNGNEYGVWRFYLNGRLRGKNTAMPSFSACTFENPKFFMSGALSGSSPQSLIGDMTTWRVSRTALAPSDMLCGYDSPAAEAYVWSGAVSTDWSTTSGAANWKTGGESVAWTENKDAYLDDAYVNANIVIAGEVNPSSLNVLREDDTTITFAADGSSAIGSSCTNFVKRGLGTLTLSYGGNVTVQLLKCACPIEVRDGVLKVSAVNSNGALGDATKGYEVKIFDLARLWLCQRNEIGSATPDVDNNSVFTVYTNGTFDTSCASASDFNIQALGTLDLLGGDFVAPTYCHGLGYLLIRNRLTLGHRPDRQPYVFPVITIANTGGKDIMGNITIGRNTEFRVEDVTGDAAADGIFNCAIAARTAWQTADAPCGFRKTGAGTMELNGVAIVGGQAQPKGTIAVEAGELRVNVAYTSPSQYAISSGAYLSGTGKVSAVAFAAGSGMRVDAAKEGILQIARADFAGDGTIEISGVAAEQTEKLNVTCARITGAATQTANLANWKVKVNGELSQKAVVRVSGGFLKAKVLRGLTLIYR